MKEAIVTGANGFIGHHLIKELVDNEYKVWAVVRSQKAEQLLLPNVEVILSDMNNIEEISKVIKLSTSDCVFYHFAWEGNSGEKRGDYALQLLNAKYTVDAAVVAHKLGCKKFVVAGSVAQLIYRDYLRKDKVTPEIVRCYAVGKMSAEAMLKCVCTNLGLDLCWTYIAHLYGEDDTTKNFINFLIDSYGSGKTPSLTPAEQLVDFVHVNDVARALFILGENGEKDSSYYIGYGKPRPLKEYVQIIHDMVAPDIPSGIGQKPFSGECIDFDAIDLKKLNRDTGFEPQITFSEGIKEVVKKRLE